MQGKTTNTMINYDILFDPMFHGIMVCKHALNDSRGTTIVACEEKQ
jgi:hypothetical protein